MVAERGTAIGSLVLWAVLGGVATAQQTWYVDDDACPGPGAGTRADPLRYDSDHIDLPTLLIGWGRTPIERQ